jgi:hypothetical protein
MERRIRKKTIPSKVNRLIGDRMILIFWPTSAIKGSHDGKIKASCATGATIWIYEIFSITKNLRYLPYTSIYANTVICLTYPIIT